MIVAFACALMSKSMAVTLPLVLLLLDYWPLRQFATVSFLRLVVEKIPLFAMSVAASIVTFLVQRDAGAVLDNVPFELRIENALVSYAVYILKFFWPTNLAVFYPYAPIPLWQPIVAARGAHRDHRVRHAAVGQTALSRGGLVLVSPHPWPGDRDRPGWRAGSRGSLHVLSTDWARNHAGLAIQRIRREAQMDAAPSGFDRGHRSAPPGPSSLGGT